MVASTLFSALVLASYAAPALALPASIIRNTKVDSQLGANANADLEPRWVALSEDFLVPGSDNARASTSASSTASTSANPAALPSSLGRRAPPPSLLDAVSRLKKRSTTRNGKQLKKRVTTLPTPFTDAQKSRAAAVSSALAILNTRDNEGVCTIVTVTAGASSPTASTTTSSPAATPTHKACSLTVDCAGRTIPANSHQYCDKPTCSFRCNSGYTSFNGACILNGADSSTTKVPAATSTRTTTTTTRASTTSTTKPSSAPSSTSTSSLNLGLTDGLSYWKQKTTFGSMASFITNVVQKFSWGQANTIVVQGVPASAWTDGVQRNADSAIQVAYPKGSRNPSASPVGGVGFYSNKLDISAASNVSLSYSVFFPKDFDFVKGGKLPGLYGGATACSGGSAAESCFSTRLMFRTGGMGELYLYAPREKQVDALCTLGPLSYCNSIYGMSIGRGSWTFARGEWTDIRQDVWLNTPGVADGGFNIWVNDKLVLHSDSVYYRNSAVGGVVNPGAGSSNMTLIDYDSLPDDLTIPNGGFHSVPSATGSGVFNTPVHTKVVAQPTSSHLHEPRPNPSDWAIKRNKVVLPAEPQMTIAPEGGRRRRLSLNNNEVVVEKRATKTGLPTAFAGVMFHTFFGGSTASWNSPKLQYSYFNGLALNIVS